jgi:hypothetical protein
LAAVDDIQADDPLEDGPPAGDRLEAEHRHREDDHHHHHAEVEDALRLAMRNRAER